MTSRRDNRNSHSRNQPRIAVIVLTLDEERNLSDLLESIGPLEAELFIVDSGSQDGTCDIARAAGAQVFHNPWDNYAVQRNWAFDNLPITAEWTLCLDADERLTPELASEIRGIVEEENCPVHGYMLRKRTVFLGRWLRWGGQYPAYHLRLFRSGRGRCENRLYDQHFVVDGATGRTQHDYIDIITDSLTKWTDRHNQWATLEAAEMTMRNQLPQQVKPKLFGTPIERKRFYRVGLYRRFPLFVRPFILFFLDYIIRLGFLDGKAGLIFHVLQRFWFRFLIDAKLFEAKLKKSEQPQ
jgi:glycosyltransferase involved in cell wall biosynthesis